MGKLLSPMDAVFLQLESHDTPMHVGGLQLFSPPPGAGASWMRRLVATLRAPRALASPWNLRLQASPLSRLLPSVIVEHDVDLDYHVRHLALPQPGGERELGVLVSRLHGHRLNPRRPLWECHVIEGLEDGRFAIYTKIHHALADGVTAMRLLVQGLGADAGCSGLPPWAFAAAPAAAAPASLAGRLAQHWQALPDTGRALARLGAGTQLLRPYEAPRSTLNGRITGQRRYATQRLELSRIKAVAQVADATVNDVVLALCSAALRRFLAEANALPRRSLVAAVPASIRPPGDTAGGNAVSVMLCSLASEVADPRRRLAMIRESTRQAKEHLRTMSSPAQQQYNGLLLAPFVLSQLGGLGGRTRPYFNVTVSNVPGPSKPLYLEGARLEAFFPVSIPAHGQALNITCSSYAGALHFGFTGCRDALPHLQRIAVHTAQAMIELEEALLPGRARAA